MKLVSIPSDISLRIGNAYAMNPRRGRLAFLAILTIIVAVMSVKYLVKISKPGESGMQSRSAFLRWREMINGVFTGENIYIGVNEYPNPPIMAIILKPFAALPPYAGALAWFYVKVLMAILAAIWVFRILGTVSEDRLAHGSTGLPPPLRLDLARAAAVIVSLPPLLGDLSHNNVNIFILFTIAACLEAYRRRLDVLAGLILALAVACKVTPLLFVAYFAWKRSWLVLGATLAGLVLWLALIPAATFGWERNRELLTGWYSLMIERPLLKGEVTTEHPNQAIPGWVYRLFTDSPSFITYLKTEDGDIPTPAEYHNVANIGRPAAWVLVKVLTALFALAVVVLCRWPVHKPGVERQGWRFLAECGLICLGMLLFSERTWKHHAVILLLPLAALCYAAAVVELPRRVRNIVVAVVIASFVLMTGPGLLGRRSSDLALVYGTHTAIFCLLTVAVGLVLACALRRKDGMSGQSTGMIPG